MRPHLSSGNIRLGTRRADGAGPSHGQRDWQERGCEERPVRVRELREEAGVKTAWDQRHQNSRR